MTEAKAAAAVAPPTEHTVELSLLKNGVDFVHTAIILLYSDDKFPFLAHKYAVLNVFSGVLLIMKERLRQEHRSLVWQDVNDVDDDQKKTVDFDTLLNRLKNVAKVALKPEHEKVLRRAQKHRNRIEHYAVELNLKQAEALVAEMIEFVFVFMRDELKESLEEGLPDDAWQALQKLREIAARIEKERIDLAQATFEQRMEKATPEGQDFLKKAHKYMILPAAKLEAFMPLPRDRYDFHEPPPPDPLYCEDCGEESVVVVESGLAMCTNAECREPHAASTCAYCADTLILDGADDDICDSCAERMFSHDDDD